MVGRAILTTVASSAAIPEPSTVIASTQRPGAEEYVRTGASAWVISRADFQRFDVRLAVDYLTGNQACRFPSLCMRPGRRRRRRTSCRPRGGGQAPPTAAWNERPP